MSEANVIDFWNWAQNSTSASRELEAIKTQHLDGQTQAELVTRFAQSRGFEFTREHYVSALTEIKHTGQGKVASDSSLPFDFLTHSPT